MYRKIDVWVAGKYVGRARGWDGVYLLRRNIRAIKGLWVEADEGEQFVGVSDYEALRLEYAK